MAVGMRLPDLTVRGLHLTRAVTDSKPLSLTFALALRVESIVQLVRRYAIMAARRGAS